MELSVRKTRNRMKALAQMLGDKHDGNNSLEGINHALDSIEERINYMDDKLAMAQYRRDEAERKEREAIEQKEAAEKAAADAAIAAEEEANQEEEADATTEDETTQASTDTSEAIADEGPEEGGGDANEAKPDKKKGK